MMFNALLLYALLLGLSLRKLIATDSLSSGQLSSKTSLTYILMGDWGTQTGSGKSRRLYEEDEAELFSPNTLLQLSNNNNGNNGNKNQAQAQNNQAQEQNKQSQSQNNKNNNNAQKGNNGGGGGGGEYWAVLVAKAMATYASSKPADFLIALGDNFYSNGVSSTTDSLWTSVYTNVYNYESLQIPWYVIFGNHDYGSKNGVGSLQAQIDFGTQSYDDRWTAGYCYMKSYNVPESGSSLDIVFIDTTLIAPEETYMTSTSAGVSYETQQTRKQEQLTCLEDYLSNSAADYLVVAGHYPIFSTGKNSPGDMTSMVEAVYPLLAKYNVDVYYAGHDHLLQHLSYQGIDFVISGAAGKPDNSLTSGISSAADMKFAVATGGFVYTEVTSGEMTMNFVDYTGAVLYTTTRAQTRVTGSREPTTEPSQMPSVPTVIPTNMPSTYTPTFYPSIPTLVPSSQPTEVPSLRPSPTPTIRPTPAPSTTKPTDAHSIYYHMYSLSGFSSAAEDEKFTRHDIYAVVVLFAVVVVLIASLYIAGRWAVITAVSTIGPIACSNGKSGDDGSSVSSAPPTILASAAGAPLKTTNDFPSSGLRASSLVAARTSIPQYRQSLPTSPLSHYNDIPGQDRSDSAVNKLNLSSAPGIRATNPFAPSTFEAPRKRQPFQRPVMLPTQPATIPYRATAMSGGQPVSSEELRGNSEGQQQSLPTRNIHAGSQPVSRSHRNVFDF